jgi:hypothetical protein
MVVRSEDLLAKRFNSQFLQLSSSICIREVDQKGNAMCSRQNGSLQPETRARAMLVSQSTFRPADSSVRAVFDFLAAELAERDA